MDLEKVLTGKRKGLYLVCLVCLILDCMSNLYIAYLIQKITDAVINGSSKQMVHLFFESLCLAIFIALISAIDYWAEAEYRRRGITDYKSAVFWKLIQKNISDFDREKKSQYISGMTNDIQVIENNYLLSSTKIIANIFMAAGALCLMLYYNIWLTIAAMLLTCIPFLISVMLGGKLEEQEKMISNANALFLKKITNLFDGFSVIKSFKSEENVNTLFLDSNGDLERKKYRKEIIGGRISTIALLGSFISQIGVFLIGAYLALCNQGVTAGILIAFVNLLGTIISPVSQLSTIIANRRSALALIKKMQGEIEEKGQKENTVCISDFEYAVTVKDLSFSYDGNKQIIKNFTYTFEKGKSYAIIGPSGCGKSTLLNLLMGNQNEYEGEIYYDNVNLRMIRMDSIYKVISYIQQNVFLFDGSIEDNISMFQSFDQNELDRAITMSGLKNLLEEKGRQFDVGINGSNLSGGEKQRISIARAILKKSDIIFADEVTAALDTQMANEVTTAILSIPDVTKIIITHNLEKATLSLVDEILVMKEGKLYKKGSYDELLCQKRL